MDGHGNHKGHGNRGDCGGPAHGVSALSLIELLPLSIPCGMAFTNTHDPHHSGEMIVGAAMKAPKFLREAGHRCPTDPLNGFMQYAFQTKLNTFQLFSSMPQVFKDFNTFMGNTMGARNYWVDWFPVQENLLEGATKESALIVDVGAGKGHDLLAFHDQYPRQGRLVLQDLPDVIDNVKGLDSAVELMTYDFFKEQPVKGRSPPSSMPLKTRANQNLLCLRCTSLLLPPHPARLAGPHLPRHSGTGQGGHEAGVLQAADTRDAHSRAGRLDVPCHAGHDDDVFQRGHGADREAVARVAGEGWAHGGQGLVCPAGGRGWDRGGCAVGVMAFG